jgi:glyceraldehyde 3-phosphate dehydrogenase
LRIAINGYGRIGRCFHRQVLNSDEIQVVAINSRSDAATHAHLLKYDSVYGNLQDEFTIGKNEFTVNQQKIKVFTGEPGKDFFWKDLKIDLVIESTGRLTNFTDAQKHLKAGSKKVLITAPCKDIRVPTFVIGVNNTEYNPADKIVSNASCTTNCVAPMAKVLHENFGVRAAHLSAIHAATGNQNILDNSHQDLRRARSFMSSIIPTKTGVSSALARVYPEVATKFSGISLRVPILTVSLVDLVVELEKIATAEQINSAFELAAKNELKGILGISHEPLVSIDFRGDSRSSIVDAGSTKVVGDKLVKILSWYDNEWGYSARVVDLVKMLFEL